MFADADAAVDQAALPSNESTLKKNLRGRRACAAALACVVALGSGSALAVTNPPAPTVPNDQFFAWFVNTTGSYVSSPVLTDKSAHATSAFLEQFSSSRPLAVKVLSPISDATAQLIFNNSKYHISYVLGDLESPNAVSELQTLTNQVKYVNAQSGTKNISANAFIGNFGFTNIVGSDPTAPAQYQQNAKNDHSFAGWSSSDFAAAKLNLQMPELYNGSASFRNPAAGNSTAPNIRSADFILPIIRLTETAVNNPPGAQIIPWISNFNNWNNLALDSDRNPANGYKFVPGQAIPAAFGLPAVSAAATKNQMTSNRDFATQAAHYRLRGATSLDLFEQGELGSDNETVRKVARTGWTEPHIDALFKAADYKLLLGSQTGGSKDLNDDIIVDGKTQSDESAGAIFSGIFSLTLKKMDVLMSNMDDSNHSLTLPSQLAGFNLNTKTFEVDGGASLLVEYKLTNSGPSQGWSVSYQAAPFTSIDNNRNRVGVPEPTTMSLAAITMVFGVSRRRRRKHDGQKTQKTR